MKNNELITKFPPLERVSRGEELVWMNPRHQAVEKNFSLGDLTLSDIEDAEARLERFAPFIERCFPETAGDKGLIESPLIPIPGMRDCLNEKYSCGLKGTLALKKDSHLAIAGSVKARGGIYEVLKYTEGLAIKHGLLKPGESYAALADEDKRSFFGEYTIQVGSTGNLGLSIGIMSAAVGYKVVVHMSSDAKEWKKELLRSHGVTVKEYDTDFSGAVSEGRRLSDQNPNSYFVDDENSKDLFLGYAVAAKRLASQLTEQGIAVDDEHPLIVYLPCGVGGAPGGITFGLKQVFGNAVHCFFVEPTQSPCMLVGMMTGLHGEVSVQDIGLDGHTHADGLAVGKPSGFIGKLMEPLISGIITVGDAVLYDYMRDLIDTQGVFIEPSACAAFHGPISLLRDEGARAYFEAEGLSGKMDNAAHIAWATGGALVPEEVRESYRNTHLD